MASEAMVRPLGKSMEEKIVISLISVGVGWLLAQGTAFAKDYLATWKLKKGLSQELVDVKEQMQRVIGVCVAMEQLWKASHNE